VIVIKKEYLVKFIAPLIARYRKWIAWTNLSPDIKTHWYHFSGSTRFSNVFKYGELFHVFPIGTLYAPCSTLTLPSFDHLQTTVVIFNVISSYKYIGYLVIGDLVTSLWPTCCDQMVVTNWLWPTCCDQMVVTNWLWPIIDCDQLAYDQMSVHLFNVACSGLSKSL